MTSAGRLPERARFCGARERADGPPIHAVEGDEEATLCGIPLDATLTLAGSPQPFMNAQGIAEMLMAQVRPCDTCRRLVTLAVGAPGEQ
jgi:hypothetical protein